MTLTENTSFGFATELTQGMAISTKWTTEYAAYTHSENHECCTLMTLKARDTQKSLRSRTPVDIVAVMDKSGSMIGEKLEMVKKTLEIIINYMEEYDRLSLVTYDSDVYHDFPLTYMNDTNKESTKQAVKQIVPGSSTNLCRGLVTGMKEVVDNSRGKGSVATVLLLTDGLPNEGITHKDGIKGEMQKIIDPQDDKIPFNGTVNTFGYGSDHDSDLLRALVYGGGMYHYISSIDKVANVFAECVGGVVSTIGQKIKVTLEAEPEVCSIKNVHTRWLVTWKTPQKKCEISVGDLQSEEQRDILVDLNLAALPHQQNSHKILVSKIDYVDVISASLPGEPLEYSLEIKRTDDPKGEPNKKIDSQRNRIITFEAFQEAKVFADKGDKTSAQQALKVAADCITSTVSGKEHFSQSLSADLRKASGIVARDSYETKGKHFMAAMMQSHAQQRSNYSDENSLYTTLRKAECVEKAIEQTGTWRTSTGGAENYGLFVHEWKPTGNIRAVIHICHGTYEHMGRYHLLAEHLKDNGILVRGIDLAGHGHSQGNRQNIKSIDSYVTDVIDHIEDTRKEFSQQPMFLMGHSDGGVVAIGVSLKIQDKLTGLVLSAPTMDEYGRNEGPIDAKFISSIQDEAVAYNKDRLIRRRSRSGWDYDLLMAGPFYKLKLKKITLPVLVIHGTNDQLVKDTASILTIKNVDSEKFEGSCHEVLHDKEQEKARQSISRWIMAKLN